MQKKDKALPDVSFIIPTLNAGRWLPRCLGAIRSQDYPRDQVEILIADGGSTDNTRRIARSFGARIIENPDILHEPGKARASKAASGRILFFTDADNILSSTDWLRHMTRPVLENPGMPIRGLLPQTLPPPDWNSFDRYLGFLSTDPFTWFVYRWASAPREYGNHYTAVISAGAYTVYKFPAVDHPLLGLSQGFGTLGGFVRGQTAKNDDILSGIKMIEEGGLIAYVSEAGIYHYHVTGIRQFVSKYTWRIRNNFQQTVKGMGLVHRQKYFGWQRKLRQILFPLYALTVFGPVTDTAYLYYTYRDPAVLWHPAACIVLSLVILKESALFLLGIRIRPGKYGNSA